MNFKLNFGACAIALLLLMSSCENKQAEKAACCATKDTTACAKPAKFTKKYTNADFYTDGKFNKEVGLKAYKEMFAFYGIPYTPIMEKDMWVTDFGLGDFENVGMGGIFWVNDAEHGYLGHSIYLLPLQMIPEHAHFKTAKHPAKFESWMTEKGMCYLFFDRGDVTPNAPQLPASQKDFITCKTFSKLEVGEFINLHRIEGFHILLAGPEGAIVSEWGSYHDGAGLRFTNTGAQL